MVRKRDSRDADRYLVKRGDTYQNKRRVPSPVAHLDDRAPHVRLSLKTSDLAIARAKRDLIEEADDNLWASMVVGSDDPAAARLQYTAAVKKVEALGFSYRPARELASAPLDDILRRITTVMDNRAPQPAAEAVLGGIEAPHVKVSKAFDIYTDEIVHDELRGKSAAQRKQWKKVKKRAVDNFIAVIEDKPIGEITRQDAQAFYRHWLARVAPKEGRPTHSASSGNRDVGNMRVLFDEFFSHMGEPDRQNPFSGLSYSEKKKRTRPPVPTEWIKDHILKPGNLAGMNDEARGILLAFIDCGARPSEICNLDETVIILDHKVPHVLIQPREDPDDPREIKTESSVRQVPLVGLALDAFKKHPKGFPRYRNKEGSLATAVNKFLRENGLLPSPKHTFYSFRHSFEDRCKDAGVDEELRRILMGHSIDRPRYGAGGSLEWRRDQLKKIVLPFDPSIV